MHLKLRIVALMLAVLSFGTVTRGEVSDQELEAALAKAGANRPEIAAALDRFEGSQRKAMRFLVAYMPEHDLKSLKTQFLVDNLTFAYTAWEDAPWKDAVPEEVFFNNVLPYANINERRDNWRKKFFEQFKPLVKEAKSPGEAAAILNQKVFPLLKVKYSTMRRRADQGPFETMDSGLASCTGLSVLLIDACRSIGVPARFAGTPLWSDKSGNHSWVEVWDDGWHFTGAAEPSGDKLDRVWFLGRASKAQRNHPFHAIYAVSYKKTPQPFPMVWAPESNFVSAVNVTDRYTRAAEKLPEGWGRFMFEATVGQGNRCCVPVKLKDNNGKIVFQGKTNDERFDSNDHLTAKLKLGQKYELEIGDDGQTVSKSIQADKDGRLISVDLKPAEETSSNTIDELKSYLAAPRAKRKPIGEQNFAKTPLTKNKAETVATMLRADHLAHIRESRKGEMKDLVLTYKTHKMPFHYKVFGDKPKKGRSLYISMHGGGGAPKQVNDSQWNNQKRLYSPKEGVYVAPRAPTDTWNLWHQGHIDPLFTRLIENLIAFEDVDPNRVYLMGYSAGGDGVYQLAPRMADQLAAASMMAGHPNETSPIGLRNLPFSLHVGGNDRSYKRNEIAKQWQGKLAELKKADPKGYEHWAKVYEGKGHWLNREDAAAVPWMAKFVRTRHPQRIVWKQDDVTHQRFYWLAVDASQVKGRAEIIVERQGQSFRIEKCDAEQLTIRLSDEFANLDEPIKITNGSATLFEGKAPRTVAMLHATLADRGDPAMMFSAEVVVQVPQPKSK